MSKYQPPEKIGLVLGDFLSERGYLNVCKEYDVMAKWNDIVGEKLFSVTKCDRVDNGILYVKVTSAPWRQEIAFLKQEILSRIKKEVGCTTIKEIVFC
jgi:predicted nucleic acid-binding Zn ribbon protein